MTIGRRLLILLGGSMLMVSSGCSGSKPDSVGVKNGKLAVCPASPNCVSSVSEDDKHHIPPFRLAGDAEEKWAVLTAVIGELPRTTIVQKTETYIHAECRSRLFRFVDDLELLRQPETGLVDIRSASRLGYSDLGVNRRRVDSLRGTLLKAGVIEK